MKKIPSTHTAKQVVSSFSLPLTLLGGMQAEQFLAEYWQKKSLLIRQAIPHFQGLLSPEELAGLACEDDVQSRLIRYIRGKWKLEHGPIDETRFAKLPEKNWTLLVQSVNQHLPEAASLLQQFNFIPYARMDDLMVSYAPDGGGVGPHFDSYDVFLLQGLGQRKWRISSQTDLSLIPESPLRILKEFHTEQEWLLHPGDMLYLPPHLAHWGIAVGPCMTYSIGFRAPSCQQLVAEFLTYLQEKPAPDSRYQDAGLQLQAHPAKIGAKMLDKVDSMLQHAKWKKSDVSQFLGAYLTEPDADAVFELPPFLDKEVFRQRMDESGLVLDLKTRMLFDKTHCFINGEAMKFTAGYKKPLKLLADNKSLPPKSMQEMNDDIMDCLHSWYLAGYLHFAGDS